MKSFIFVYAFLCWLIPTEGYAAVAGYVINVSHGFKMAEAEPTPPRDYYLDLGTRDGIKNGDLLEVSRQVSVPNASWGGTNHLLRVVLAEVKVLVVGETASIARVTTRREAAELPTLNFSSILVGDSVGAKNVSTF